MRLRAITPAQALGSVSAGGHLQPRGRIPPSRVIWPSETVQPVSEVSAPGAGRDLPLQRLEAVLVLAREPLASRKLAQLALLEDGTQARTLLRRLNELYDVAGRSFRVEEVAGGYQLLTRPKFAAWLRRLGHVPQEIRLSTPALETLAVVAYRQPVLKADIEAIRGVHCGEILRQLMERDLVRIGGRSEELGRPYLYTTTKRFLQQFGLRSLEDLPRSEILRISLAPPVGKPAANGHHTPKTETIESNQRTIADKESDVSLTLSRELETEKQVARAFAPALAPNVFMDDDEEFEDEVDDEEDDDDEEDELEDDEEEEDELEEEEWEEVEDAEAGEEEEDDEEDEDDEDWDDEEDEDWDDEDDDEDDDEEEEEADEP